MISKKRIIAAMLAAPAALAFAMPAQAQVAGIATATPSVVLFKSKAFGAARQQISTTFKSAFDQMQARQDALEKEIDPLRKQLDTNRDGKVTEDELRAAQAAKNPVIDKIQAAQEKAREDIGKLNVPPARAELFAIESILRQYEAAQLRVITARKVSVVLTPDSFLYAPDSVDISDAIVAEIDKSVPSVSIQPPADWQPSREALGMQQQLVQLSQLAAYQAAAQQQRQQQAAAPAGGARPAAPASAKPAEPR